MNKSESNATRPPSDPADPTLWRQWHAAAALPVVDRAIRDLYRRLDVEVASHHPVCRQSGRCCHFDSYGHLMYVTGLEVAWLLRQPAGRPPIQKPQRAQLPQLDSCPFQIDGLCSVHALRPTGCRVFFCDPTARQWESAVYDGYLHDLRALHDRHHLDYRYIEWRSALRDALAALKPHVTGGGL